MLKITSEHLAELRDLERSFQVVIDSRHYNIVHYARNHIGERNKMLDANREKMQQCKSVVQKFSKNFELFYTSPETPSTSFTKDDAEILQYAFAIKLKNLEESFCFLSEMTVNDQVLEICKKEISDLKFSAHEFKEYVQENS